MHIGDFLPADGVGHFTGWIPRGADNAVFTYEHISTVGSVTLTVEVYEKDSEDSGPGSLKATINNQISTSRFYEEIVSGLKELVRFRITCGVDGEPAGSEVGAVYRILAINWFNTIEA